MLNLALLSKVKLYMKSVIFHPDNTITNNSNPTIQAISYANAMYCYIGF